MYKKIQNILFSYKFICLIPFLFSVAAFIYSNSHTPKNLTEIWINKNLVDAEEIEENSKYFYSNLASINNFNLFINTYGEGYIDESNKLTLINEFKNFWLRDNQYNFEQIYSENTNLNISFQYHSLMKIDVERLLKDYVYYCFYQVFLNVTEKSKKETQKKYEKFETALKLQETTLDKKLLNEENIITSNLYLGFGDIFEDNVSSNVMNFIFSTQYISAQIDIYKVLLDRLNKKYQTILEKINSYSLDLKKQNNLDEMEITWSPIVYSFTGLVNINKLNYTIQGFIFGLIISIAIIFIKLIILKRIKLEFFK